MMFLIGLISFHHIKTIIYQVTEYKRVVCLRVCITTICKNQKR